MVKLLRIDSQGSSQPLTPADFANEVDELQSYIAKNPAILGDNVTVVAQQLDTGAGDRLDMLALEEIGQHTVRPAIVELKNVEVDTDALLQVLRYSDWVLSHTDSVRLYAEKAKVRFTELDNTSVRVIIVAPAIKSELLELSNYIVRTVEFGFLEFGRFKDAAGDVVVLDWKSPPIVTRSSVTAAQEEWDWESYENSLKIGAERIRVGRHLYDDIVDLNSEKGWGLTPVFRKFYIPFKKSGYNVVQIELWGKYCALSIRLVQAPKSLGLPAVRPDLEQEFSDKYKRYWIKIPNEDIPVRDFVAYIEKSLELV